MQFWTQAKQMFLISIHHFGVSLPPVCVTQESVPSFGACLLNHPKYMKRSRYRPYSYHPFLSCSRMSMLGHYSKSKMHQHYCLHKFLPNIQCILWLKKHREILEVLRRIFLFKGIICRKCSQDYLKNELRK